jgi:hypothetical protein
MNESPFWDDRPQVSEVQVGERLLTKGDRVRLWPQGRADIFDMTFEGMTAKIESIESDFEGRIYFAVTIDDDPGRDLGELKQSGHRFFFGVEEVEAL